MRKQRSDKGVERIDWTHKNTTYDQKLRAAQRIEKKLAGVSKRELAYREYLQTYADRLRKGHTMETLLTKKDFQNWKTQLARQGERVSGKEVANSQTIVLTELEAEELSRALAELEKDWGEKTFDDLSVEGRERLNHYFSLSENERQKLLRGLNGELFRKDAFDGFASLSTYYNLNSPHER